MHRKDLIPILRERARTVHDLVPELEVRPAELEDDLRHLARSLRGSPTRLIVEPAVCRKCGFTFGPGKLGKPGRCPMCRETWIQPFFKVSQPRERASSTMWAAKAAATPLGVPLSKRMRVSARAQARRDSGQRTRARP